MRAVLCTNFDGADALKLGEAPEPVPAADEVLIDVRAAAVSFMDKLMAEGGYQLRPALPYVPEQMPRALCWRLAARSKPSNRAIASLGKCGTGAMQNVP